MKMRRRLATLGLLLVANGCSSATEGSAVAAALELVSSAQMEGTPGWEVDTIVIRVVDKDGQAMAGVSVVWDVMTGAGAVRPLADASASDGTVRAVWVLGIHEGTQLLSARVGALPAVRVEATAVAFHATAIAAGDQQLCALDADGYAYCWGYDYFGTLGVGSGIGPVERPTRVLGDLRFTTISLSNRYHACALTADGTAYCWGNNGSGQVGNGTTGGIAPVPVAVVTAERFVQISAGDDTTCAVARDGRVLCWGGSAAGLVGDGTAANQAYPTPIRTSQAFASVKVGTEMACAITSGNALWCWGKQGFGPGGFGGMPPGIYPPTLLMPDHQFVDVSSGWDHACGLAPDGTAWCWGLHMYGALGNDTSGTAHPLPVAGTARFRKIDPYHTMGTIALAHDGTLYRWGEVCCHISQLPQPMVTGIRFVAMDGRFAHEGAIAVTGDGAVYDVPARGDTRAVPPPVD